MVSGTISESGYKATWTVSNGYVHITCEDYKKAPMKLLPGKSDEENARWLLKELVRAIKLGTAKRQA
jgi:hypothetical protein